jgi:hypothetical protein
MRIQLTRGHRDALLLSGEQTLASLSPLARYGGFEAVSFPDTEAARAYLRGFLSDRGGLPALRKALTSQLPVGFVLRLDDEQVVAELARRLVTGRLYLVERRARPTGPALEAAGAAAAGAPRPGAAALAPASPPPAEESPAEEPEEAEDEAPLVDPVVPEEVNLIAQAAVMQQAAESGASVCEA